MKIYSINFGKLGILLLPVILRKSMLKAFVRTAMSGIAMLHVDSMKFRRDKNFRLTHNGQRCYLRGALNELYDPIARRIIIGDGEVRQIFVAWHRDEERQLFLPTLLPWRNFSANGIDFTVCIPPELFADVEIVKQIRATTNAFKLASKTFEIIPITN